MHLGVLLLFTTSQHNRFDDSYTTTPAPAQPPVPKNKSKLIQPNMDRQVSYPVKLMFLLLVFYPVRKTDFVLPLVD